jgi:hypothetical protein
VEESEKLVVFRCEDRVDFEERVEVEEGRKAKSLGNDINCGLLGGRG